ncbi:ABC transporter B family member 4 isoform X2 [Selaginella moellendorffii]|uniref:ABC transporter B family member 4 isoform X2 n=1 Tax=Selaginella moellendorffii TaxID=88036 RepID=UPI000D1CB33B|nr:ABC transporter B family member 4 isoform X2 [Selaginella moellendorffii]|eukprot:XP_024528405.1 ABC transporter B family member 4 isoform X2 [Selaginella moellendorffii]
MHQGRKDLSYYFKAESAEEAAAAMPGPRSPNFSAAAKPDVALQMVETPKSKQAEVEVAEDAKKGRTHEVCSVPFYKLFYFADPLDYLLMFLGTLGAMANGFAMPALTIVFGQLANAFGQNSGNIHAMVHEVSQVALRFVYLGGAASVASFGEVAFWICTGERQAARIRGLYLKSILRQDVAFFDKETTTGEVVGRMSGDTILIQEAIGEKVGKFIQLTATFLGGFAVAFTRGWKLTLVMLSALPLIVAAGGMMAVVVSRMSSRGQVAYAEAGGIVDRVIGAIRTVASFTGEKRAVEDYDKALKRAYSAGVQQGIAAGLSLGFLLLIVFSSYALALWYGSKLVLHEGFSGGRVMNVIFAVLTGGMALGQTSPCLNAFASGQAAAYKMFEVIHRTPEIDAFQSSGKVPENVKGDIEFRQVDFSYPSRPDVQIFSKFSLGIPSGMTTALVGESGSGKSTVISLIERFYDPQAGEILLDGTNLNEIQLKWLRHQIGLVSQEPVLFGTSIKENIGYGKEGATLDEIQNAAYLANAARFINKLPQAYDTQVGEHGAQLSGGQKQRVAIARAILKNPRILLLDEATSALDAESERLVQEALDRVMTDRTTVVIAHRLTTIRNAHCIAVVQHGAIVETGTHFDLVQRPNGAYSQLVHLQEMHQPPPVETTEIDPDSVLIQEDNRSLSRAASRNSPSRWSFSKASPIRWSFSRSSSRGDGRHSFSLTKSASVKQADDSDQKQPVCEDIETGRTKPKNISIFRLATLNKPEVPIVFVGSLAAAANGVILPLFGLLLSSIIGSFFEVNVHTLRRDVNFWSMMFLVLACSAFVVAPAQILCFSVVGNRLIRRIRTQMFEKILRQEISWFDASENSSGALGARLSSDAAHVRSMVGDTLSLFVQNVATVAAGLVLAFTASWQLALLVLALVPLIGLQHLMQVKFVQGFSADAKIMYEEASQVASEAVSSIRTVASYCAEVKVMDLYKEKCSLPLINGVKQGIISGVALSVSNFVLFGSYAMSFWFGSRLVEKGETDFKRVFRVFFAITMSSVGISQSAGMAPDIAKVKTAVNSVFSLLDRKSKVDPFDKSGKTLKLIKGDIEFRTVCFKYPSRPDVAIFQDLSLLIPAGKTVALVGESGSGKSTLISLVERFYEPDSGQVLLDGIDIRKFQVKWLRQQMGLVSQEPVLFDGTIRWNIAYGKEGAVSDEEIQAAAEASNAHKFISGLPEGYKTRVGERGVQLSGGQKQRVAIARAIVKNPRILLLDEATSALDAESEHLVQEALDRIKVKRTSIVIAHRLATIVNADVIAVVKNGAIVERGKHADLIGIKGGAYASLAKLHLTAAPSTS